MKYLGYELRMEAGQYAAFTPDGVRIGSGSKERMRKWIREHRAAARPAAELARHVSGASKPGGVSGGGTDT